MSARSRSCSEHPAHHAWPSCSSRSRPTSICSDQRAQGIFSRAGQRHRLRRHPGRAGHFVSGDGRDSRASSSISIKADPAVEHVMAFTGGNGATNAGFMYLGLKPLGRAQDQLQPGHRAAAPQAVSRSRGDGFSAGRAGRAHRRASEQRAIPIHDPERNLEDLVSWGPVSARGDEEAPGLADVNTRPAEQGPRSAGSTTIARRPRAWASRRAAAGQHALRLLSARRWSSTMYTPLNQYYVVMEAAPRFWQTTARVCAMSTCIRSRARSCRSTRRSRLQAQDAPALWPSTTGAVSVGDDLVQPRARRGAERCLDSIEHIERQIGMPRDDPRNVFGNA